MLLNIKTYFIITKINNKNYSLDLAEKGAIEYKCIMVKKMQERV